jgi:hypothetical protein
MLRVRRERMFGERDSNNGVGSCFSLLGNRVQSAGIFYEVAISYGLFCQVRGHSCCSRCTGGSDNSRAGRTSLYYRAQITFGPGFSRKCNVDPSAADPLQLSGGPCRTPILRRSRCAFPHVHLPLLILLLRQ